MSGLSMNEMRAMDDHQIGKRIYDSLSKTDQILLGIEFNPLSLEQTILRLGELYREAAEEVEMDDDVEYEDLQIFAGFFLDDED
ncbi:hypothetical protein [Bacillus toyonensis]|uniref:hypothetical protein n=1 Tax=Bacillus toyonensis TaxID=155322 RepID=UPI000BFE17E9|nr:hypothetical protein [Bacillus toyonensis]PHE26939.1 hypothetical protein COF73_21680 [Bacillus toyonensis]